MVTNMALIQLSIIILNISDLTVPIKTDMKTVDQKQDPTARCLQETHFKGR
jgi:hypothetical protein